MQHDATRITNDNLTDEDWRTVLAVSERLIELPIQERRSFLDSVVSDPKLIREVLALVPEYEQPVNSAAHRDAPGDRFVLVECIGRGGMGDVYVAHDIELDRKVALKFLNAEVVRSRDALDRFIQEARTASALNHPNIVTVYDVIRSEMSAVIVMEYVEGRTLRELYGQPIPTAEILDIGLQIAEGLAAAHARGIIHRDLKPENIIVHRNGRLKVLDFGLALRTTDDDRTCNTDPNMQAGTLRYMSPEHATGEKITIASDVFSFGLILYELCTGRYPFATESPLETLRAIIASEPVSVSQKNPSVPEGLVTLVGAMMSKHSQMRPSAKTVVEILQALRDPKEQLQGRQSANRSARRAISWAGVCVLIAVGAIASRVWKLSKPAKQPSFYQVTTLLPENRATAAAISPDGKAVAYATVDGVFLRANEGSQTTRLSSPPNLLIDRLEWFKSEAELLVSGSSTLSGVSSVWTISLNGALPTLVRTHARFATVSPNAKEISFLTDDTSAIWTANIDGTNARQILAGPRRDTFTLVFWSPDSRRLSFQRRHATENSNTLLTFDRYYERSYESVAVATGHILARVQNLWVESALSLSDGRVLFLPFYPAGTDISNELWEVKTRLDTGAFLEAPHRVARPISETPHPDELSDLSSTEDGMRVLVLRRSDQDTVFVADFQRSPPKFVNTKRLTLDDRGNYPHAWTPDSRAVIFESDRNGSYDLFKQALDRRTPETIVATPLNEVLAQVSPDGGSVLYAARPLGYHPWRLMRESLLGGVPQEVPIGGALDEFRCALKPGRGCVLRVPVRHEYYVYYDLDPTSGKGRELARTRWTPELLADWDVSPDGQHVAIPIHDPHMAQLRLVSLSGHSPSEEEIYLPGLTNVVGVTWAAAGDGWFVHVGGHTRQNTPTGDQLLYVSRNGHSHLLGNIRGWAVPSPDGRRVAFTDRAITTNAWIIDRG